MYNEGDTPGVGKYECTNCGHIVEIKSDDEALPICPTCGNDTYKKVD